jgi:hypothetical protein
VTNCPKCGSGNYTAYPAWRCNECQRAWLSGEEGLVQAKRIEIDQLKQQIRELRDGLKKLEWCPGYWDTFCPACQVFDSNESCAPRHEPDCWLSKLLEEK